ncbi:MAG: HlyD family efflux transporter periplasmic adaptor subunit [Candidatus Omnitrophica bacterium]|nr:HlyD family efflux transporter periplasmic adaptor subunit [Candidatus Omnitrophota bacterium]MBU1524534.1 HlyD family efflux transporter periplasmic adaptor subunit [Candidatus Omnitrophota bacterium]MBU1810648.1 HlyD family efflux transporter periplasmic adaptor subunit [Candidatus Omnitrophota bacterium]MBU2437178.1 HlyD family efflux transporter periplasmic adaptor subunit [Candidatus Omnitrophota bacterium]MBU2504580.1 HlyD family efflux transporter periplasmic adaptor subunit [Candidat
MQKIKSQLKLYQKDTVYMPIDGVIWNVFRKNGELVKTSDIVIQVIDANRIWVDAFFRKQDSKYLSPGTPVTIVIDNGDRQWQGKIRFFLSP